MKKKISNLGFGLILIGIIVGSQYFLYWLFSSSAKEAFYANGKYTIIAVIAFSFFVVGSAAFYAMINLGRSKSKKL